LVAEASPRIGVVPPDPLPLWVGSGHKNNHQFMFSIQMLLSWHWVSVLRPIKARWRCTPIQFILQARNTKSLTTMTS